MAKASPAIARTPAPYARITSGLAAGLRARGLVHLEGHRHAHPAGNRLAILERRLERPLLHRLQRDLVEHAGRLGLLHPRIGDAAVGGDIDDHHHLAKSEEPTSELP